MYFRIANIYLSTMEHLLAKKSHGSFKILFVGCFAMVGRVVGVYSSLTSDISLAFFCGFIACSVPLSKL